MTNADPIREGAAQGAAEPAAAAPAPVLKLEDFLPHRLNVLSSLVSQALTRVYGRRGIGIPEWRVLVAPADRPAFDRAMKQLTERSAELVAETERGKV